MNPEGSDPVSSSVQVCWGPGYGPEEETHTGASGNGGTGASGVLVLGGWALSDCGSPQGVTPRPSYQGNARTNGGYVSPAQTWWAGPCTPGSLSGTAGNQMAVALQLVSPAGLLATALSLSCISSALPLPPTHWQLSPRLLKSGMTLIKAAGVTPETGGT